MWRVLKEVFSKDTLLSIRDVVSLKDQTERSKQALLALPELLTHIKAVLTAAPYLIFIYAFTGLLDIQQRTLTTDGETIMFSVLITIVIITIANALVYVETYNTHTTNNRIEYPLKYALWRIPKLFAAVMLSTLIIILGLFMLIIPGIYFALRLALVGPACMMDDTGIRESMFVSLDATNGQLTMIQTAFSALALLFFPLLLGIVAFSGILELVFVMLLFGLFPLLAHMILAHLYLNGIKDGIDLY